MPTDRRRIPADDDKLRLELVQPDGTTRQLALENVSPGGFAARWTKDDGVPVAGELVNFRLQLGDRGAVSGSGRVVWMAPSGEVGGLGFVSLDEVSQRLLGLWLAERGPGRKHN